MEARVALYHAAVKQGEDVRAQIRKHRDAVAKGFKKHQPEYEEVRLRVPVSTARICSHGTADSIRSSWRGTWGRWTRCWLR